MNRKKKELGQIYMIIKIKIIKIMEITLIITIINNNNNIDNNNNSDNGRTKKLEIDKNHFEQR